ncbi:MAG: hypothetical protein K6A64_10070 [Bacteroidales bacterium]|nr:hypothetical protein [Bacteroidales bacterium]
MNKSTFVITLLIVLMLLGCGAPKKIDVIRSGEIGATLAISGAEKAEERRIIASKRDSIMVHDDERGELYVMHAVAEEESGEMVATDVLDAAVVTAYFRNVAERHGKIDIRFDVIVPKSMQDTKWQLRFFPDMFIMQDSIRLETVIITGAGYRKAQLRGYEQYDRFLRTIISDTTKFIDLRNLELFIKRNIPEVYKYKNDTTCVSDEVFHSYYGVTEQQAIEHYTNIFARRMNDRRRERRDRMYARYVKVPIVTEGIRLDTVIQALDGDFIYQYTQVVNTRPGLRKIDIVLSGDIYESDHKLYSMAPTPPLSFYVSSLSSFTDNTERYLTRVVERRAAANTSCYVDFAIGKFQVDPSLGNNARELGRIRGNIFELMNNRTFDLDSIVISASASPDGKESANRLLAQKRAASVAEYMDGNIRRYRDSLMREQGLTINVAGEEFEREEIPSIRFLSRSNGENWSMLSYLVDRDTVMSEASKRNYIDCLEISNLDERERRMQGSSYYNYMKQNLYPRLRTVRFDFYLHRKGMVRDTIHTTELDTTYMKGVEALRDRDYKKALEYLREYQDFNTAIAYVSLDYNASAMAILQELERTPRVNYMLAVLYARKDDDAKAVQCYLDACKAEPSYVFRGKLDPEIYVLIQRYGLNRADDEDDYNL